MQKIVYIFNCPVHGEEDQMFCFRAGDSALRSRWRRYEVTRVELPILYDPAALEKVQEIQRRLRGERNAALTLVTEE